MKYLKTFESYEDDEVYMEFLDKLQEFCEIYLIDLIERPNFFMKVYADNFESEKGSLLYYINICNNSSFTWGSAKDEIIPFFTVLCDEYKIGKIMFYEIIKDAYGQESIKDIEITADQILNDTIANEQRITLIKLVEAEKPERKTWLQRLFKTKS